MDFVELLIKRIDRHYTKDIDMSKIIFSFLSAYIAFVAIFWQISKDVNESAIVIGSFTVVFVFAIWKIALRGHKDNANFLQIESMIISHCDKFSHFDTKKKEKIITMIDSLFSKKNKDCILIENIKTLIEEK